MRLLRFLIRETFYFVLDRDEDEDGMKIYTGASLL